MINIKQKYKNETLKELSEDFYIISKNITGTIAPISTLEEFYELCEGIDLFSDGMNWGMLEAGRLVFNNPKKLSFEEVEIIKNDKGSYRDKAEKYNVSTGTIHKIMNDIY